MTDTSRCDSTNPGSTPGKRLSLACKADDFRAVVCGNCVEYYETTQDFRGTSTAMQHWPIAWDHLSRFLQLSKENNICLELRHRLRAQWRS